MKSSPSICNINLLPQFYMVGDFLVGHSKTDCKFNSNINVNVTVDTYMKKSFNLSSSRLLKNLLASRITRLEVLAKLRDNLR